MTPESSNPARLLLFGRDLELLEIRAKVLRSAGMIADISVDLEDFKVRITLSEAIYDVVVCCHTALDGFGSRSVLHRRRGSYNWVVNSP